MEGLDAASIIKKIGDDPWLLEHIGRAYVMLNELDQAEIYLKQLIEVDPDSEAGLEILAQVELKRGNIARTGANLARLIEINPDIASIRAQHAQMMSAQADNDQAIAEAELALQLDPTLIAIRTWLASVYETRGDVEKSEQHRTIAEKLNGLRKK